MGVLNIHKTKKRGGGIGDQWKNVAEWQQARLEAGCGKARRKTHHED